MYIHELFTFGWKYQLFASFASNHRHFSLQILHTVYFMTCIMVFCTKAQTYLVLQIYIFFGYMFTGCYSLIKNWSGQNWGAPFPLLMLAPPLWSKHKILPVPTFLADCPHTMYKYDQCYLRKFYLNLFYSRCEWMQQFLTQPLWSRCSLYKSEWYIQL